MTSRLLLTFKLILSYFILSLKRSKCFSLTQQQNGFFSANTRATFLTSRISILRKKIRRVSGIALAISSSRDSERNIDGLQDFRMGESVDGKEIEVYSDSDLE